MHATVWKEDAELVQRLAVFLLADVELEIVETSEALLHAEQNSDFVIIDCSLDLPGEVERCRGIVERTALPVHIIHPQASILAQLRPVARRDDQLRCTSPEDTGLPMLGDLFALAGQSRAVRALETALEGIRCVTLLY